MSVTPGSADYENQRVRTPNRVSGTHRFGNRVDDVIAELTRDPRLARTMPNEGIGEGFVPVVGDQIELAATKVGQVPRAGVVIDVRGNMLTVRWPSGEQSSLVPAPGTLSVVERKHSALRSPRAMRPSKRVTTAKPAPPSKTSKTAGGTPATTRSSTKKVPATKVVAKKTLVTRAVARTTAVKRTPAKKTVAKRAVAKKTGAKTTTKPTAKNTAQKAPVRKMAKRSTTPKRAANKQPARKRGR
jgi:DNA-binding protein HU-beta